MKTQTPIRWWKKFHLSFFSRGMLYAGSSGIHLFTFAVYFLILSQPIQVPSFYRNGVLQPGYTTYTAPFGYNNPPLWDAFYIFYTIVAALLFWHGLRVLYKGWKALPDYTEELDTCGYETDMVDRT